MRVVFGCPVYKRGWILPTWFDHVAGQDVEPEDVEFVFVVAPGDHETIDVIALEMSKRPWGDVHFRFMGGNRHEEQRRWTKDRYALMAQMRNVMLGEVSSRRPDWFFSLDSDILLPPDSLGVLIREADELDVGGIGPLTYMTPTGVSCPNVMSPGGVHRPSVGGEHTRRVWAVFGAVLMRPRLYESVKYAAHPQGEDIGWATNVRRAGETLALCPQVKAKHVMEPSMLSEIDLRVGF